MNAKKGALYLGVLSLFSVSVLGAEGDVNILSAFSRLLKPVFDVFNPYTTKLDPTGAVYAKILIWLLVFALFYFASEKLFREAGQGIKIMVPLLLSIIGVLMIPDETILYIFKTYSLVISVLLWGIPILGAWYLNHSMFDGEDTVSYGGRTLVYGLLVALMMTVQSGLGSIINQPGAVGGAMLDYLSWFYLIFTILFIWNLMKLFGTLGGAKGAHDQSIKEAATGAEPGKTGEPKTPEEKKEEAERKKEEAEAKKAEKEAVETYKLTKGIEGLDQALEKVEKIGDSIDKYVILDIGKEIEILQEIKTLLVLISNQQKVMKQIDDRLSTVPLNESLVEASKQSLEKFKEIVGKINELLVKLKQKFVDKERMIFSGQDIIKKSKEYVNALQDYEKKRRDRIIDINKKITTFVKVLSTVEKSVTTQIKKRGGIKKATPTQLQKLENIEKAKGILAGLVKLMQDYVTSAEFELTATGLVAKGYSLAGYGTRARFRTTVTDNLPRFCKQDISVTEEILKVMKGFVELVNWGASNLVWGPPGLPGQTKIKIQNVLKKFVINGDMRYIYQKVDDPLLKNLEQERSIVIAELTKLTELIKKAESHKEIEGKLEAIDTEIIEKIDEVKKLI